MGLKLFVKVSEISNLSDARYCAGMGVDMLGFSLKPDASRYVTPESFNEITNWVAGVQFVGEFGDMNVAEIKLSSQNYPLDFIQVDTIEALTELSELNIPLIYKIDVDTLESPSELTRLIDLASDYTSRVIVSSGETSLFSEIDAIIKGDQSPIQLIKAYDLSVENVEALIGDKAFAGIELQGSEEERPGFNDYGDLMDILEVLDED